MVHQYLVRYTVKSNFKMNVGNKFDFPGTTVIVNNSPKTPEEKCKWPNTCIFDVITSAENIDLAMEDAFSLVDGVIGLFSVHMATSSDIPILEKAIEWDDGIHERCFVQNIVIPYNIGTPREFDPENFSIIFSYLNREDLPYRNAHPDRMERAVRWYRKAIAENDLFSKHTYLWVGLEIVNPIIRDKYLEQISKHSLHYYNKEQKPDELISLAGIKFLLLERCHYSYDDWKSIKETRDLIIHGSEPLETLKNKVAEHVPKLERSLQIGIFESIGIPEEKINEIVRIPYPPFSKTEQLWYLMLHGSDKSSLLLNDLPDLCVEKIDFNMSGDLKKPTHTISTSYMLKNYTGSYHRIKMGLKGSVDPEFKNRNFKVIEDPGKKENIFSKFKRYLIESLKKGSQPLR
jgi:hypothetical protein